MRFVNILAAIVLVISCYAEDGKLVPVITLEDKGAVTPEMITSHVHLLNPGAEVGFSMCDDAHIFNYVNEFPSQFDGMILGVFHEQTDGFPHPRIMVLGHWSQEINVSMHELVHYLEYMIPDRRVEIREAFRKLHTNDFNVLAGDEQDHVGHNGKPNPIVMGFPTSDE